MCACVRERGRGKEKEKDIFLFCEILFQILLIEFMIKWACAYED